MKGTGITQAAGRSLVRTAGRSTSLIVDLSIYTLPAVLRSIYRFSDRCFFFLRKESAGTVTIHVQNRKADEPADRWLGDLANELLDQQLRQQLGQEAGPLRELIAAQAFAEGNLLDADRDEGDYLRDPLGIGRGR